MAASWTHLLIMVGLLRLWLVYLPSPTFLQDRGTKELASALQFPQFHNSFFSAATIKDINGLLESLDSLYVKGEK